MFRRNLLLAVMMLTAACRPDHFKKFDGASSWASFKNTGGDAVILRDLSGESFRVSSASVFVEFEINRIGASKIYVSDAGHVAKFELPKSVLNNDNSTFSVPYTQSKQPVDLRVTETTNVLSQWNKYRHVETPIIMQSCTTDTDGSSSCYSYVAGYNDDYYRDTYGIVDRGLDVEIFPVRSAEQGFPEPQRQGSMQMLVTHQVELLGSVSIGYSEYQSGRSYGVRD